ncbi:hypothetical protein GTO27_05295 [Candidatus Bathyarchaeota archaeon]|nr:hypothetical protein [Candidatus Bathyarchaeota archaeon]
MGGKKKLSLKQMERSQSKKGKSKKKESAEPKEKKLPRIVPPDSRSSKVVSELQKMRVLTPYSVASRFNVRISAAKDLLRQLEERGVVHLVSGNHKLKVYGAAD